MKRSPIPELEASSARGRHRAEPLEARFPEPLDRALIERLVTVVDAEGHGVSGRISITEAETIWRFVPDAPWRPGTYRLTIGTELEDVAGNSVASPFEVDLTTPITKRVSSERVEIPFAAGRASIAVSGELAAGVGWVQPTKNFHEDGTVSPPYELNDRPAGTGQGRWGGDSLATHFASLCGLAETSRRFRAT